MSISQKTMRWAKQGSAGAAFLQVNDGQNAWVYFKDSLIYTPGHIVPGMPASQTPDNGFATMQTGLKQGYILESTLHIMP